MGLIEWKKFIYKIKHQTGGTKLPFKCLHKKLHYALLCEFQTTINFPMLHFWSERISDFGNIAQKQIKCIQEFLDIFPDILCRDFKNTAYHTGTDITSSLPSRTICMDWTIHSTWLLTVTFFHTTYPSLCCHQL